MTYRPSRRRVARAAFALPLALALGPASAEQPAGDPVVVGVSGPLTGQYAQYGAQWRKGFDLVVEQVNASGGIKGRPLAYQFEDTQSDPKQAVAVARKFAQDPRILVELGDFSSAASMAASPVYQSAGLVQFGFTNSHPDFTKGGDHMWSNAPNQADDAPQLADYAVSALGYRKIAVLFINNDWGRTSKDIFAKAVAAKGGELVGAEGYLADDKDFRSPAVRVRDKDPDAVVLISYYPDGAQIVRQMRAAGLSKPIVAAGPVYSPKFLELGGEATNGVHTLVPFFPEDPRPIVQTFNKAFRDRYGTEPDSYNARAYDALLLLSEVMRRSGPDRKAIQDGLASVKEVPSVVYGTATFNPQTRRVEQPVAIKLVVRDGRFTLWTGKQSAR